MRNSELDAVWQDFSSGDTEAVASKLGTSEEQALQEVANKLIEEADSLLVGIWRFSFDVLTFAFFALLVLVFVFVARQSFPHGKSDQVVLVIAGGIPKYHVITATDVVKKNVKTIDGSLSDVSRVYGHYSVEPISSGAIIRSNQLSSGTVSPAALQGRQVLSVPIKDINYKAKDMPVLVSLYLSPKAVDGKLNTKPIVIKGVYILASGSNANGDWAAVALTPDEANAILPVLGSAELYVSEAIP